MRRVVVGIALAVPTGMSVSAALKQGEKAPDFSAKASLDGKEIQFSLADALKKGPVVVYFYPSAFTGVQYRGAHVRGEQRQVRRRRRDHHRGIAGQPGAVERVFGRPGILRRQDRCRIRCRWGDCRLL